MMRVVWMLLYIQYRFCCLICSMGKRTDIYKHFDLHFCLATFPFYCSIFVFTFCRHFTNSNLKYECLSVFLLHSATQHKIALENSLGLQNGLHYRKKLKKEKVLYGVYLGEGWTGRTIDREAENRERGLL